MKLFTALAALALIAAPAQAFSVEGLIGAATVQVKNGAYGRACKTVALALKESAVQGYSTDNQIAIEKRKNDVCNMADAKGEQVTPAVNPIKQACMSKWGTDYTMVKYCYDQQTKAKHSLGL